ncbi:MAG: cysteine hydrolase [Rhodobacteraceae bacterium]|nr:MAG: cysteine hydrolase [Paracoccaceae bacterium]TNF15159.1 MAG: cysteine hydrolase [Paracoccaceae bacterium]
MPDRAHRRAASAATCSRVCFPIGVSSSRGSFLTEGFKVNALILIDIQAGFEDPVWGERNNPQAEDRARDLLQKWRDSGSPIIHVRHVSTTPGSPLSGSGTEFKAQVQPLPGETIIEKSVNSAFIGTNLNDHLKELGANALTICGLTTPHCVSTTTRMAANLGYRVRLVADACAAFTSNADVSFDDGPTLSAEEIHRSALAHLHGEFARVCLSTQILSE